MGYNNNLKEYYKTYLKENNIYTEEIYQEGIKKIKNNIPIQYIIGNVDFYGNIIKVNESVLIPRFETELLIEKTTKYIKKLFNNDNINIIDLGTGSGCIAITLKKILPNATIDAIDISEDALKLAKENATMNNVQINYYNHNMSQTLPKKYDIIISNPPYISKDEEIMDLVKNNEPHLALYAENNGLYYYEQILKNNQNNTKEKYLIAFEIGYKQAQQIKQFAIKYLNNPNIVIEKDLSGKDRYIFIYN